MRLCFIFPNLLPPHKTVHLQGEFSSFPLPVTRLGELGRRGLVDRDINGVTSAGDPRGPFDIADVELEDVPTWPALWAQGSSPHSLLKKKAASRGDGSGTSLICGSY